MADNNPRTKKIKKRTIETFEEIEMVEDPVKFNNPPPQGNLLRGFDNCLWYKFIRRPWTTALVTIFSVSIQKHKRGHKKSFRWKKKSKNQKKLNHFVSL